MSDIGREMMWDDQISNDSSFEIVPAGDYEFTVTGFERSRTKGQGKLPPCNMAVLTIEVKSGQFKTSINHYLVLHTSLEWKLCEFFRAIGSRKKGEAVSMKWSEVIGSRGRCKVIVETFKKNDGTDGESNKIEKFYDPDTAPAAEPKSYQEGTF